jgi:ABC-2 type transport system ATP-binding protein
MPVPKGSGILPLAVRALDEAGIDIADITLRHPTLDEVFLSLTMKAERSMA